MKLFKKKNSNVNFLIHSRPHMGRMPETMPNRRCTSLPQQPRHRHHIRTKNTSHGVHPTTQIRRHLRQRSRLVQRRIPLLLHDLNRTISQILARKNHPLAQTTLLKMDQHIHTRAKMGLRPSPLFIARLPRQQPMQPGSVPGSSKMHPGQRNHDRDRSTRSPPSHSKEISLTSNCFHTTNEKRRHQPSRVCSNPARTFVRRRRQHRHNQIIHSGCIRAQSLPCAVQYTLHIAISQMGPFTAVEHSKIRRFHFGS